ncbi:LuxR C-terminal-related transcriptional regulator [Botrimarina sp.]|uniref:response regulator transcription factor n=1 Tax=Botrimarina sp. TaxID=2795802 RepID=UPI0032EE3D8C
MHGTDKDLSQGTVYAVENDPAAREALEALVQPLGYRFRHYNSAAEFFSNAPTGRPACLVLDYNLPGVSNPQIAQQHAEMIDPLPVIITADQTDLPMAVRLLCQTAVTLLEKPFRAEQLTDAIRQAIEKDAVRCGVRRRFDRISEAVDQLSSRETQVLQSIVAGQLNKSIARNLNVSVRTIEGDRARIVDKFGAETTGEVVGKYAEYRLLAEMGYRSRSPWTGMQ